MTVKEAYELYWNALNSEEFKKYSPLVNPNHPLYKQFQEALNKEQERLIKQMIESGEIKFNK